MDKFENIIFTHSTMGYEAIGRKKKKVAIFTPNKLHDEDNHFGWPASYKKKYNFFFNKKFFFSGNRQSIRKFIQL